MLLTFWQRKYPTSLRHCMYVHFNIIFQTIILSPAVFTFDVMRKDTWLVRVLLSRLNYREDVWNYILNKSKVDINSRLISHTIWGQWFSSNANSARSQLPRCWLRFCIEYAPPSVANFSKKKVETLYHVQIWRYEVDPNPETWNYGKFLLLGWLLGMNLNSNHWKRFFIRFPVSHRYHKEG